MAGFFCDSSAIVKRYVNEAGSIFVDNLADLKSGNIILSARITRVEVAAAIARRLKSGSITATDAQNALADFQHDLTNNYYTVEITPGLLSVAVSLATRISKANRAKRMLLEVANNRFVDFYLITHLTRL